MNCCDKYGHDCNQGRACPLPMAVDYLGDEPYTLGQVLVMFIAAILVIALIVALLLSPILWGMW